VGRADRRKDTTMSMDIALTGGIGRLGRETTACLLAAGHTVRSLDRAEPAASAAADLGAPAGGRVRFLKVDLNDLDHLTEAIRGCDAVIHLAAFTGPWGQPPGVVYANNTLTSYNVLYAATSLGIERICLASSVNALGGIGSQTGRFDYFPVDERHPTYNEDDYSLSKWVMEQMADSFARRYPNATLSSLRLHALPDAPPELQHSLDPAQAPVARNLWGWTLISEAARACLLAVTARYRGHEVFYITAPRTISDIPSLELARHAYPEVAVRGDLSGHNSFYDCSKAARLLGWKHV
jgi:nucleoside-diphosphate-sugar epimerase